MEILQRKYSSLTVLLFWVPYLFRNCSYRIKIFVSLLARQAFSSFRLNHILSFLTHYLKLYANEQIVNNDVGKDSPISTSHPQRSKAYCDQELGAGEREEGIGLADSLLRSRTGGRWEWGGYRTRGQPAAIIHGTHKIGYNNYIPIDKYIRFNTTETRDTRRLRKPLGS